MLHLRK
jgi:hypothetical protein